MDGTFGYIADGPPYLARDLKDTLAQTFYITLKQRFFRLSNGGKVAFDNYVNHVLRFFTREGIHTGPNGGKHKDPDEMYYPIECGLMLARRRLNSNINPR